MDVIGDVELSAQEFLVFQKLIHDQAGIYLAPAKHALVQSRLSKRLRALNLASFRDYLDLLRDPASNERESFVNSLTTNKTEFFREQHHFDFLQRQLFSESRERANRSGECKLRIWCAASSSGEEPYSLAMMLREEFGSAQGWDLRILATDIDTDILRKAAKGCYSEPSLDDVSPVLRKKYFRQQADGSYIVRDELKELITFRKLNLNQDEWPIHTSFDAIFCRNVMIYFDQPTQHRLVNRMIEKLRPGGYLMIGHSESLLGFPCRLESLGQTTYRLPSAQQSPIPNLNRRSKLPAYSVAGREESGDAVVNQSVHRRVTPTQPATPFNDNLTSLPRGSKFLIVGEYFASSMPCEISTTLGSCVAACLFDSVKRIGGMNHFMLPETKLEDTITASYGVHAMELLINEMMNLGAKRGNLRAKIFGGAAVIEGSIGVWNVGARNIEFVKKFLTFENIPLDSEYVGGTRGMRICLDSPTFRVKVRLLDSQQTIVALQQQSAVALRSAQELFKTDNSSVTLFQT